jgi:hypothetical protein
MYSIKRNTMSQTQEPQVITLNDSNSVQILVQYVEVAQKSGAFLLAESDLLKRCRDVLLQGASDAEVTVSLARQLLVQAVNKGQAKGAYNLDDASILHKVCQYVGANLEAQAAPQAQEQVSQQQASQQPVASVRETVEEVEEEVEDDLDDLNSLSAPVPLKTPKPKVV